MQSFSFNDARQWAYCVGVLLYNGYSLFTAYRTRPVYGSKTFWTDLRSWLTIYNPVFRKVAAASPPTWDDKLTDAISDLLFDETLWSVFVKAVSGGETIPDESARQTIAERIRTRLRNRFFVLNDEPINAGQCDVENQEQAQSVIVAVTFLSLVVSSVNLFQFIRNWRKARQNV